MKAVARTLVLLSVVFSAAGTARAVTIWTGPTITFGKSDYADWTLPENQDRITDSVRITRMNNRGIFNIAQDSRFHLSPSNTEWAFGSAADWQSLYFQEWPLWHGWQQRPELVGEEAVLHLIEEDVYLDITLLSWTHGDGNGNTGGGGFSYERATEGVAGEKVWSGPTTTFTKADFADWTLPANQDRITDTTWITRQDESGIYNAANQEDFWDWLSPADTEWAFGSASDWQSLDFDAWQSWHDWDPRSAIGHDAVLHLISDDIYMDIEFLDWTDGGCGGGFSYERSSPVPEPGTLVLLVIGVVGLLAFGWPRYGY